MICSNSRVKAWPNAHNISTQNLATSLDCVVRWCEGALQTCATSCNIQKCCNQNLTIFKIYPKPSNTLQHFATGCRCTCPKVLRWNVACVWPRLDRASLGRSRHLLCSYWGCVILRNIFLSCGIEPLHEQSLPRWSLIMSTNLPADDYQCVCKPGFTGHYCETGQLLHWAVFFMYQLLLATGYPSH